MRESLVLQPQLLQVSPEGHLLLPVEQLQHIGIQPGDRFVMSFLNDGAIYLHKTNALHETSRQTLRQKMQEAFNGYDSREKIIQLLREVRQEMAAER